ncbi:DNA replication licensing factor MCM2 isoform X1 [Selaginella moellendorffii]|uniref:DNA replication licensing factor MCM2 isoform X1 n=2 Tax=Selaginella moellendorffii TaxID=88036 RepID=UPI000D1D039C|nr:DNA replication licensing factor MCM2 isoform X1 [Selaginella moellendorffii]|eukprot:XP_024528679.1 DNA replication licensing factor MCM2 isoform X1 [Selaginella moellendorffii]
MSLNPNGSGENALSPPSTEDRLPRGGENSMSEAEVDPHVVDMGNDEEEEEVGEDLYTEDFMQRDYQPNEEMDRYDSADLDDEPLDERSFDQIMADRRAAEAALDDRDEVGSFNSPVNRRTRNRKLPAFLDEHDESEDSRPRQRARVDEPGNQMPDDETEEEDEDDGADMYNIVGNLRTWVSRDDVRRFIARKFRQFLLTYVNPKNQGGQPEYVRLINDMVSANKCSLEIDYTEYLHAYTNLAIWLADAPESILEVMEEVLQTVVLKLYPNYGKIHERVHVRVTNLPVFDQIRDIRKTHLNCLIRIGGVVTRRSGVFPQLMQVKYDCNKCGATLGPFFQNTSKEIKVGSCPECQSRGPFSVNVEETIYRNYQKLTLQESPGIVPAGRLPRYKEVILLDDLIDCARPGEEIEITGIYTNNFDLALNTKNGFPVFATVVEANHVSKKQDLFSAYKLTEEDKLEIEKLAKDPRIGERIIKSIAPSIYGHENIKTAIALAMFGGQEKNVQGKHRLRGDINILLLGDPGTAKSQFLKYVEKTAQRAVYTTGKGASAVGLTAAVHKDPVTREWTLEGGALVLADRGICLIDEFDKMNDQDRVSIHEAMEQQSISISKAGIVTSLQARCSVIAAANPVGGRYDSGKTFALNVELTDPILSRFDILLVVKDTVDPVIDEMLARFVVDSHFKSHPNIAKDQTPETAANTDPEILSQDMLRKYITYAKLYVFPKLHDADLDKVALVYADLRRESMFGQGVPIAVRHIESMIRIAEAHARMHLRQYVLEDDVDMAIRVLLDSFIATQKYGVQKALQKSFKKYMTYKRDFNELLLHLLRGLVKDALRFDELMTMPGPRLSVVHVKITDLEAKAREYNILDLQPFFNSRQFLGANFTLDVGAGVVKHPVA